jgi:type II secretory pathway pseudopilin PulG
MLHTLSFSAHRAKARAFSLVEVVIAVGIFAVAVISIVGLILPNTKRIADQLDAQVAQRLSDNIRFELERYGFKNITSSLNAANDRVFLVATNDGSRVLITGEDPYAAWSETYSSTYDPDSSSYTTVASRQAAENALETAPPPGANPAGLPFRARYFLVEVGWPIYPQYKNDGAAVPLNVRVMWPYRLPNGPAAPTSASAYNDQTNLPWRVVPPAQLSTMLFNITLTP